MFKAIVIAASAVVAISAQSEVSNLVSAAQEFNAPISMATAANRACKKRCKNKGGRNCYAKSYFKRQACYAKCYKSCYSNNDYNYKN